ncbi:hypothetical protein [Streptomyces mayteni]
MLEPGLWCERVVRRGDEVGVQARRAARPIQALIWMRVEVRTVLSLLDADESERVFRWLSYGQWEAIYRLRAGGSCRLPVRTRTGVRVAWEIRPVLFLPTAGRCTEAESAAELAAAVREAEVTARAAGTASATAAG